METGFGISYLMIDPKVPTSVHLCTYVCMPLCVRVYKLPILTHTLIIYSLRFLFYLFLDIYLLTRFRSIYANSQNHKRTD